MMLVQKSLHDVATVQAPETVKRRKSEYAERKSALIEELNFLKEFTAELLPTTSATGLTFEEKQRRFHESRKSVKVSGKDLRGSTEVVRVGVAERPRVDTLRGEQQIKSRTSDSSGQRCTRRIPSSPPRTALLTPGRSRRSL